MRAFLVYGNESAHVYEVESFNLAPFGRRASLLFRGSYRECETFARGMIAAGARVSTASCSLTGDIVDKVWSDGIKDCPFPSEANPVYSPGVFSPVGAMRVEVRPEDGCHSVFVNGERFVDRESFTIAHQIAYHLRHPDRSDDSESCEVAESIRFRLAKRHPITMGYSPEEWEHADYELDRRKDRDA